MKAERARSQKFKDEMEDLMEATEGKLTAMREALELEIQQRVSAEAQLDKLTQAQSALQQSFLEDEMPSSSSSHRYEGQPLLMDYN